MAGRVERATSAVETSAARSTRPAKLTTSALLLAAAVVIFVASAFAIQFWQLHTPKKTAALKQQLKQEMIAAKAEVDKQRIRALTVANSDASKMEKLRYSEAHQEALAALSRLREEHEVRLDEREWSEDLAVNLSFLCLLLVSVVCTGMALVGVILMVRALKARRSRPSQNT